ncbi:MAG: D-glycero-beta-D-manno-heptose 1-phosphate adenylyltransferase [FCB group bacterium]|nr:D-glycero-beta-D-manno-heptose 1-phosphate adenylyltransferase [FCB group bacterium]
MLCSTEQARQHVTAWSREGATVVFTNGCFDLLHRGHVDLLTKAGQLGDYLVVGLNSDRSVRALKGPERPYQPEEDRAAILDALKGVSLVIIFDEDTPLSLIRILKPGILVKGGDYSEDEIVGAQEVRSWGGRVEILPFLPGYSSSALIRKIRRT